MTPPLSPACAAARPGRARRLAARALLPAAMFCAGWVGAAVSPYAVTLNAGLVNSLDSVGKNLFGAAVFGARIIPTDPCVGGSCGAQLDVAADSTINAKLGVFRQATPGDPCRTLAQIEVLPPQTNDTVGSTVNLVVDSALQQNLNLVYRDLSGTTPNVARCQALTVPGG